MPSGQVVRPLERNLEPLHRRLADFNRSRLNPSYEVQDWQQQLRQEMELRTVEGHFLEAERGRVQAQAEMAPHQPRELVNWLEGLKRVAFEQSAGFFPWLAEEASSRDMSWFLAQEMVTERDVEDLLALTQVKQPWRAKLEMARDYWDEMGQGNRAATRAKLLDCLIEDLHMETPQALAWESLARHNLMLGLATNRRYAYQALGALGIAEATAAEPAAHVNAGLARLGFSAEARGYFAVRERLAPLRAHAWNEGVVLPLVARDAGCATAIAEGALMRLSADARCWRRYLSAMQSAASPS